MAWKEHIAEYWLKQLQDSMDPCTEILLKMAFNTMQTYNYLRNQGQDNFRMPTSFKEPHAQLDNMEIHCGKFLIILMETIGGAHTKNCLKKVWTDRQIDRQRDQNLDKAACYNYIKL